MLLCNNSGQFGLPLEALFPVRWGPDGRRDRVGAPCRLDEATIHQKCPLARKPRLGRRGLGEERVRPVWDDPAAKIVGPLHAVQSRPARGAIAHAGSGGHKDHQMRLVGIDQSWRRLFPL